MQDNSDPIRYRVKRELSKYEKRSVLTRDGRALVLPGCPPREVGHFGEIDELIQAGWESTQIIGVEGVYDIAEEAYDHYRERCQIHWDDVNVFLADTSCKFSYVHLDWCAHLHTDELDAMFKLVNRMRLFSRVRMSVSLTRRSQDQMQYEDDIRQRVIRPLLTAAAKADTFKSPAWQRYRDSLLESTDTTQIIIMALVFNQFFRLNIWDYADECTKNGPYLPDLPEIGVTLLPVNVERFTYHEVSGRTHMHTTWADLVPISRNCVPSKEWVLSQLTALCESLVCDIPHFNPDIFMPEDE